MIAGYNVGEYEDNIYIRNDKLVLGPYRELGINYIKAYPLGNPNNVSLYTIKNGVVKKVYSNYNSSDMEEVKQAVPELLMLLKTWERGDLPTYKDTIKSMVQSLLIDINSKLSIKGSNTVKQMICLSLALVIELLIRYQLLQYDMYVTLRKGKAYIPENILSKSIYDTIVMVHLDCLDVDVPDKLISKIKEIDNWRLSHFINPIKRSTILSIYDTVILWSSKILE